MKDSKGNNIREEIEIIAIEKGIPQKGIIKLSEHDYFDAILCAPKCLRRYETIVYSETKGHMIYEQSSGTGAIFYTEFSSHKLASLRNVMNGSEDPKDLTILFDGERDFSHLQAPQLNPGEENKQ